MISARTWNLGALVRLCASAFLSAVIAGPILISLIPWMCGYDHKASGLFIGCNLASLGCLIVGLMILQFPWRYDRFVRNLAAVFVCSYSAFFLVWLAGKSNPGHPSETILTTGRILAAVISFQGATLIYAHFYLRQHNVGCREAFGLDDRVQNALLLGIALGMIAVPVGGGLQFVSGSLMDALHMAPQEQQAVQALRGISGLWNRIALGVTAIILAPLGEEILFRGILYPAIKQLGYPRLALFGSSILFGLIHMNMATFIPLTVLALAFVWLYEKTGNLLAPIVAHSVFNLINFIILFVDERLIHMPGPK